MSLLSTGAGKGVVSAPFDPLTDITWYASYYAEGTQTTPFVDATTTAQWDDNSGNIRHATQGTPASRPTYRASVAALNSRPALEYSTDCMVCANATFGTLAVPYTIIVVGNWVSPDTSTDVLIGADDASIILLRKQGTAPSSTQIYNSATAISMVTPATDGNAHIFGGVFQGANSILLQDDLTKTGTLGTLSLPGITIGGTGGNAASATFNLAFVGIYSGDITVHANWGRFKNWTSRYGVTT